MAHALGIDIGSTNVKVAIVAQDATIVAAAARPLSTVTVGEVAEQDAVAMWDAVVAATAEVTAAAPVEAGDVATIGVASQYSSTIPTGPTGEPVGPAVMYFDTRGSDHCWAIMGRHPDAFDMWIERHGIPPVGAGLSLGHMLHLQLDRPDLHQRTTAYLEPMDYVTSRLTGRITATQCTMFTSQLCDNRSVGGTEYDDDLVAMSGVDAGRLPTLIEVDGIVGPLSGPVAEQLGLPPGVEVRAGMNDSHASAFGTGAFDDGRIGLMIGTTAVLLDAVGHHAIDLDHEIVSMPAPMPDSYLVWAENGVAGRSVDHAIGALLGGSFDELAPALSASAPGAGGALFLPWFAGAMAPSATRSMRGGFLNLSFETTRQDLIRATVEGTARNVARLLPFVEAFSGHPTGEIVFGGGAARSSGWAQVIAVVLGHPVAVLDQPGLTAAAAAGVVALRRHQGDDPLDVKLPVASRHEPDSATAAVHAELQGAFEAAFEANRAICEALNPVL
jgi:xylulokinase